MQLALETLLQGPVHHGGTHIWMGGNDGAYFSPSVPPPSPLPFLMEKSEET